MKDGFAFVDERVPGMRWDAKYATWDNFTGKPVDGYGLNRIIGTTALCAALSRARAKAAASGFGLLLWDGYRPQRAAKSAHSRGTVDLTLYHLATGELAAMGGDYDLMDSVSHHAAPGITDVEAANRRRLHSIMTASGFGSYAREWWHYTLTDEPYPDTYFDFPIS